MRKISLLLVLTAVCTIVALLAATMVAHIAGPCHEKTLYEASDYHLHLYYATIWQLSHGFVNFGYYAAIAWVTASGMVANSADAAVLLLAASKTLTAALMFGWLYWQCRPQTRLVRWLPLLGAATLLLLLANPLPYGYMFRSVISPTAANAHNHHPYLGALFPNVWHNSTTIFTIPFALLLFGATLLWLRRPGLLPWLAIALLVPVNLVIKPSFILAWAPATGLLAALMLWRKQLSIRDFGMAAALMVYTAALLLWQKHDLYNGPTAQALAHSMGLKEESAVEIGWLDNWAGMKPRQVPGLILRSVLLPVLPLLLWGRHAWQQPAYRFALVLLGCAVAIPLFIHETGARATHGNFLWTPMMANTVAYTVATAFVLKKLMEDGFGKKELLRASPFLLLLLLQCVGGGAYLAKYWQQCLYY